MSTQITLDLTASFVHVSNPTPFALYDTSAPFISASDGLVKLVNSKLGGNVLDVELKNIDVYAAHEEAVLLYSSTVNSYQAKSVLADILGSATGSLSGDENKLARLNLALAKRRADAYSTEALVGGTKTLFSASITTVVGQQNYDLKTLLSSSGDILPGERAEIREVFHFSPTSAYRFFDTTSAVNYLHNEFSFESFTPETVFYLLPIWEDVLRAQQLETSHKVRRSNYSYDLINNMLKLYPTPTAAAKLYFTFFKVSPTDDPFDSSADPLVDGVANLSNVPFGNIAYEKINSIGRHWIRRYTVASAKETLGHVRGKISQIPIPNSALSLNGPELVNEAKREQIELMEELKLLLDSMTYDTMAERERDQAEALQDQLAKVPLLIYMGSFVFCFLGNELITILEKTIT